MFIGITYLARVYHIVPEEGQTAVSLLGRQILGNGPFYYFIQVATLLILLLAATTLCGLSQTLLLFARDGFCPRQLSLLGDRLVYSNGIILLSLCAAVLVVIFRQVNAIIPSTQWVYLLHLPCPKLVRRWFKQRTSLAG